jgi:hypothetical protein
MVMDVNCHLVYSQLVVLIDYSQSHVVTSNEYLGLSQQKNVDKLIVKK